MTNGISTTPAGSPSTIRVASTSATGPAELDTEDRRPDGHLDRGRHQVVVPEAVVVEHQPLPLDVEAETRVLGAARVEHPAGAGGSVHDGGQIPAAPTDGRRDLRGQRRHRGEVGVVAIRRMWGPIAEPGAEELDRAIVQREHAQPLGLSPPTVGHGDEPLRLLVRQVVALGAVRLEVVQLPRVVVEARAELVAGDRLPAVDDDPAVTHHLEVLHALAGRFVGHVERVVHGGPADGELLAHPCAPRAA